MYHSLDDLDHIRVGISQKITQQQKSELGHFMTPLTIARFMASLFRPSHFSTCRLLLDPGAGIGSLSCAFIER